MTKEQHELLQYVKDSFMENPKPEGGYDAGLYAGKVKMAQMLMPIIHSLRMELSTASQQPVPVIVAFGGIGRTEKEAEDYVEHFNKP